MSIHFKKSFSDSSLSYHLPTFIKNIRTFDFRGNCRNKNIWIKGSEPDLLKFSSDFINDNFNNIYFKDNSNSWLNYNDHNYIIFKLFNRKNTLINIKNIKLAGDWLVHSIDINNSDIGFLKPTLFQSIVLSIYSINDYCKKFPSDIKDLNWRYDYLELS